VRVLFIVDTSGVCDPMDAGTGAVLRPSGIQTARRSPT